MAVWYLVEAVCPHCLSRFNDLHTQKNRVNHKGRKIPYRFECDRCLEARVGKAGVEAYKRLKSIAQKGE
jgi:hypothetical protein